MHRKYSSINLCDEGRMELSAIPAMFSNFVLNNSNSILIWDGGIHLCQQHIFPDDQAANRFQENCVYFFVSLQLKHFLGSADEFSTFWNISQREQVRVKSDHTEQFLFPVSDTSRIHMVRNPISIRTIEIYWR